MLTKMTSIQLTDDERDWELYSRPDAHSVAKKLNEAVETHVNRGAPRAEVEREVEKVMALYALFGAADTEPRAHLAYLLDRIYVGKA